MNKFLKTALSIAAKQATVQGDHKRKIIEFYGFLVRAARKTFTEDNKPTLDCFLEECHRKALDKNQ